MLTLKEVRDYISSLGIAADANVYCGIMSNKPTEAIGVYPTKEGRQATMAIGGVDNKTYRSKGVTLLVHWNKSTTQTETAAIKLYSALERAKDIATNAHKIKFIMMIHSEPIALGRDDEGIDEYAIETLIIYESEDK